MLQKLLALIVLVAGLGALMGCEASGPRFQEVALAPEQAVVYAYRHSAYSGSAVTLNIAVDGKEIGGLQPNGYLYSIVSPGKHLVSCKTESESAVEVDARAGASYYVEGDVVLGFWVGRPKLVMVAPEIGRANIGGKKYCGPKALSPAPPQ